MRVALYFTPPRQAALTRLASEWLGRDAFDPTSTGARDSLVAEAARYGFHATMKAPFRLAEGVDLASLDEAVRRFAAEAAAPRIGSLALRSLDGFLALVPQDPEPALDRLAAETVRRFEPFRAETTPDELARRRPDRLAERQRDYLHRFGYPYVFEEFRFHMTLTGRLERLQAEAVERELRDRFAPVIGRPLAVDGLALFVEPEPGSPFHVHTLHTLSE